MSLRSIFFFSKVLSSKLLHSCQPLGSWLVQFHFSVVLLFFQMFSWYIYIRTLFLVLIVLSFLFFSFLCQRWITVLTVPAKTTEHVKIFQMATIALAVESSKDKTAKVRLAYPFTMSTANWIKSVLFAVPFPC